MEPTKMKWSTINCLTEDDKTLKEITSCSFDTSGNRLACVFGDHRLEVFSGKSESHVEEWDRAVYTTGSQGILISVDWNDDGTLLAAGGYSDTFYIFSCSEGKLSSFTKLSKQLTKLQWNRKGLSHLLLTSFDDGAVEVWNCSEQTPWLKQSYKFHTYTVRDIQWLTKMTFASCSLDGNIFIYRVGESDYLYAYYGENAVLSIHYNPLYECIFFFSYDLNVKIWTYGKDSLRTLEGHKKAIYAIDWRKYDDFCMLASGGEDRAILIWNINNNFHDQELRGHSSLVTALSFSPNGQYLASADINGIVNIWSVKDWSLLLKRQCTGTILDCNSLKWNLSSTKLAVANNSDKIGILECIFPSSLISEEKLADSLSQELQTKL